VSAGHLQRVIDEAGLAQEVAALRRGELPSEAQGARIAQLPLAALCALADALREAAHGADVRVLAAGEQGPGPRPVLVEGRPSEGPQLLRRVAMARITHPTATSIAVDCAVGLSLSEAALQAGADALMVEPSVRRLPVAGAAPEPVAAIEEMTRRCGRRARWERRSRPSVEQAS
jgi:hypothetical protein